MIFNRIILFITFIFITNTLLAHKPNESYIFLKVYKDRIEGTIEITFLDLNKAIGSNIDTEIYKPINEEDSGYQELPDELHQFIQPLGKYIKDNVSISSRYGNHQLQFRNADLLNLTSSRYFRYNFILDNTNIIPDSLLVDYDILLEKGTIQKGALVVAHNWKAGVINNESMISMIFSSDEDPQYLDLTDGSIWKGFWALVRLGIWHIYIGLDHILFLIALLLPSVVRRKENFASLPFKEQWIPVDSFKSAFFYIIKIATLFTIAHSITLSLAAFEIVNLSARLVESLIALSIGIAAYLIIKPIYTKSESIMAFGFGLFHGLGFASVLGEKGLNGDYMVYSLLGFNIGVEIGQLLIICFLFPFLYFLGKKKVYTRFMLFTIGVLIFASLYWFIERFFNVEFYIDDKVTNLWIKILSKLGL